MAARRPGNVVDDVYQTLRERIVDGVYAPGFRMSQGQLAADLNVSRTPLREALNRLGVDGLLVGEANRGMEVAPARDDDVEQFYAIRLLVEPTTLAATVGRLTGADLDDMDSALEDMRRNGQRVHDFQEAHLRFHEAALRRYPPAIGELTRSLHLKIYRHQRLYFTRPHAPEHFTHVDEIFLAAIRDRDIALTRQLLEFHLVDAAMGLILDRSPDHVFGPLLMAVRGIGVELDTNAEGRLERPARIAWRRDDSVEMPLLETVNVLYTPQPPEEHV
jgi:DNA-binding GntR family transcriptional regulator